MKKDGSSKQQKRFQEFLIEARKDAGLTQTELAAKLGKPQPFVSRYESGERRLDVLEFIEVCKSLGASPSNMIKRLTH